MNQELVTRPAEISLKDILGLLRRRRAVILQTFIVIVVIGGMITMLTKPVYRSTTRILVEGKSATVTQLNANDVMGSLFMPPPGYDVATQIEVLQSERLMQDAFLISKIPYDVKNKGNQQVKLIVKQVGETNVIELAADSQVKSYCERLTKNLPAIYLKYITSNSQGQVGTALNFAQVRLKEETEKLSMAEVALERFKKRTKVVNLDAQRQDAIQRNSQADSELRRAEAENAAAQARLDTLMTERRAMSELLKVPTTITNITKIETQKDVIAKLKQEREKLLVPFKANSPKVLEKDAEIKQAEAYLATLPPTVTTYTETRNPAIERVEDKITEATASLTAARATLADVRARAAAIKGGLSDFNDVERTLNELQREIDQRKTLVTSLNQNVNQLQMKQQVTHDPVITISPPSEPEKVAPRVALNMVLSVLLGLMLGIGLAMLQEYLDDRVNSTEEARQIAGASVLGYVPLVAKQEARLISDMRSGSTLESYRVLRSNVQFATVDETVCSLMVTSTNPGEGKSMTACNLAIAMALDGKRVILVDADLRLPTIHEKMGLAQQPGLTNVLLGRKELEEALQPTDVEGLRVLTAGSLPPNPAELLNSLAMRQLHEDLKELADIVIFDCPPCLATADAQVMASVVDGVLYVMQLGETKKSPMRHSMEMLRQAHGRILGVIFNKIDMSSHRDDYYYSFDSYYSNGKNGKGGYGYLRRGRDHDEGALVTRDERSDSDRA